MLSRETALPPVRRFSKGHGAVLVLKIAVTLGCFWYVFRQIDMAELRRSLPGYDVRWAIVAVLLLVLEIPLMALRWSEILAALTIRGKRLTYTFVLFATAAGMFFAQVLPAIVGDGMRVWFLARVGVDWRDATVSVVIDRCVGVGLLLAMGLGILLLPSDLDVLGTHSTKVLLAFATLLLIGMLGIVLGARLSAVLSRWRYTRWIAIFMSGARDVVFGRRSAVILGAGCMVHALTIAAIWSLGRAQGLALPPMEAAVLFAVMIGVMLIPISFGGWGFREFAVVSLFGNYGLAPERALMFSVSFGLTCIVASLPGAVLWFICSIQQPDLSSGYIR